MSVVGLRFDQEASEIRSWVTSSGCSTSITDSELIESPQHGIAANGGSLTVTGILVEGSSGNGVVCTAATCSISTSRIIGSQLVGIDATPIALQLGRSLLTENVQGGIRAVGGTCDITNNFVFRNGNDADGTFGGMRLEPSAGGNHRIEHNTIVFNDSDPAANPAFAGGLFCKNAVAPNNLVYNNFAGNNSMPNSQVGGGCNFSGSLISNGDGGLTNEMHFAAPVAVPFDYHLADALSPAVNAGASGSVSEDFDGDQRTGVPDVGADEFGP